MVRKGRKEDCVGGWREERVRGRSEERGEGKVVGRLGG